MLAETPHLQNLGLSFHLIRLQYETSGKVTAMVVGGRAGVHHRRGFWRRRQDARSTANAAVILILETGTWY
jgi:hypothetical protein